MENYFDKTASYTAEELNVDIAIGLSEKDIDERLSKYGENRLEGKKEKTIFQLFINQFKDTLVIILLVASVISIGLGEPLEGGMIFLIVVLNAVLGVYQENKASNALKALKEMASPQSKVIRSSKIIEVPSDKIVPGDIVILEAGDYMPADVRLIETINMKVDESALTGESVAVLKDSNAKLEGEASLGDRINCGYMSSVITFGRGKGIVTETGMNTQMGKIASMLNETEEEITPLQKKLNSLGKMLGVICIAVCLVIFGLGVYRNMYIFDIFITAVALAVAAVPEGLTVVVTVILAVGMQKMVKSNAIIKRLSAVETLGSTTTICSDKTGTLTQNKMTVVNLYDNQYLFNVTGTGYAPKGEIVGKDNEPITENVRKLIEGAVLCNDSQYNPELEKIIGDPTEGALLVIGKKMGLSREELNSQYPRINELPFDSDRKLMSTFHKIGSKITMYTKGAPDEVLRRTHFIYKNGEIKEITQEDKDDILKANTDYANAALRVLGVAFKEVDNAVNVAGQEENLIFIGLLSMIDPPREEAKDAISVCKTAGIQVKMITGDHKITASAIGKALGILSVAGAIEGREIDVLSDEQLQEKVKNINVFARVSPEHKVRLVTAIKANGEIVAMTGDGVNDAPSLKRADIGIAMGITGTDVSKEAADMILTDDNFASIVKAVREGRTIYNNIRKVVSFLLSCNIGEILVIFVAMLANLPVPLASIQLLMINLITDAFPAFALGMEKEESGTMSVPPRDPNESIVDGGMKIAIGFQSAFLAAGALLSFVYARYAYSAENLVLTQTCCFVTLVMGELFRAYSSRSEYDSIFKTKLFDNGYLNKTVFLSIAFLFVTVYVPFLNSVFGTTPLSASQIGMCILFALLPLVGGELSKLVKIKKKVKI